MGGKEGSRRKGGGEKKGRRRKEGTREEQRGNGKVRITGNAPEEEENDDQ